MALSVFDLFTIGIGPSSSHTVGPMRAARRFAGALERDGLAAAVRTLKVDLFGSLGATGKGHGTDSAVMLGLEGETPETVDPDALSSRVERIRREEALSLQGRWSVVFRPPEDICFHRLRSLPEHPNGMQFAAIDAHGAEIARRTYFSVGGGLVPGDDDDALDVPGAARRDARVPHPFLPRGQRRSPCARRRARPSRTSSSRTSRRSGVTPWARSSRPCGARCKTACAEAPSGEGVLPGRPQGAREGARRPFGASSSRASARGTPLAALDWVNLWALAVNEENAAGGRVVTAPTNGAAGASSPRSCTTSRGPRRATRTTASAGSSLTAGAIGSLYKMNASISGAEVGCQGEVGVACSMAAAGLTEALGGTPEQVENAAEIGMEHNLGLTCDPIGGLVQVPCIERNAMGAVKAINASRIALAGDGKHKVSLDKVIATMRQTGADMLTKYKETSRGGLAVNIVEC